jgi:hypothetical protein
LLILGDQKTGFGYALQFHNVDPNALPASILAVRKNIVNLKP